MTYRVWRGFQPPWGRVISLVSSMERTFQLGLSTVARALSRVVFPEAVTPAMTTNPFISRRSQRYAASAESRVPAWMSSETVYGVARSFLMLKELPSERDLLPPGRRETVPLGEDAVHHGRGDGERAAGALDEPGDDAVELVLVAEEDVALQPPVGVVPLVPDLDGPPRAFAGDVL